MARTERGPSFADRVARASLSPQQRENARATLLLAELVNELCDLITEQTGHIAEQNDRLTEQNDLLDDIRNGRRGDRTPSGPDKGKGGGGNVQIREPAVPPPDPDNDPANSQANTAEPKAGGTVADQAAGKSTTRRPAAKTAASKTTTAKTTPTARRRGGQE